MKQPDSANGHRHLTALGLVGAALATMLAAHAADADTGRIRHVTDGDTVWLASGEQITIAGIDPPEIHADRARCALEIRLGIAASATARGPLDVHCLAAVLVAEGAARSWPRRAPKSDCRQPS